MVNDHWNTVGGRQDWGRLLASVDEQTSAIKDVVDAVKEQTAAIGRLIAALQAHDAAQFGDGQIEPEGAWSPPDFEGGRAEEYSDEEWAEINRRAQWQDPLAADKARGELG